MNNSNKTALIICSTVALLIVAGVIMFIVWQNNKDVLDKTDMYSKAMDIINTPITYGNNIYDVMLAGQRNDSTANGTSNNY